MNITARFTKPHWLGTAVRKRRKQLGLSLDQLGVQACIHFQMLEDIENGLHFPSSHYLQRLLNGLRISFIELRRLGTLDQASEQSSE